MIVQGHPKQAEVEADLMATYSKRPGLAMVDSNKVGISSTGTNTLNGVRVIRIFTRKR